MAPVAAQAAYTVLWADLLNETRRVPIAVLLLIIDLDELHFRFRPDVADVVDDETIDVLEQWPDMIAQRTNEEGATALFRSFEDSLSNCISMSDRQMISLPPDAQPRLILDKLFAEHVQNISLVHASAGSVNSLTEY